MMWASLTDALTKTPMGVTAENLAAKYDLTREQVDNYALRSQHTWGEANAKGVFADEIAPIEIKTKKGVKEFTADEHPRPQTQIEGLAKHNLTPLARIVGYGVSGCEG